MNDENKTPNTDAAPRPPEQTEQDVMQPTVIAAPGGPAPDTPGRSIAKVILGVVVGTIAGIVIIILIVVGGITYLFSNVTSGCDTAIKNMKQVQTDLQTQAKQTTVSGKQLESVSVYANGDCLTGSGAVLDASVAVNTDARSAHAAMLQAFGLSASGAEKFKAGTANGSNDIDRLVATVKEGDREYTFTYRFTQLPSCPPEFSGACYGEPDIVQKLSLLDKPVNLAEVSVTQYISQE